MPGRPEFSTPGSKGANSEKVRVSSRPEVDTIDETVNATISSGGSETVEIYAPTGAIYRVRGMKLSVGDNGSATSGNHSLSLSTTGSVVLTAARATYDSGIKFQWSHWKSANSYKFPNTEIAQLETVKTAIATENAPLTVKYNNNTDADQSSSIFITFVFEEESY